MLATLPCWRKSGWPSVFDLLFFGCFVKFVRARDIERLGGGDQLVGQDQLGIIDGRQRHRNHAGLAIIDRDLITLDPEQLPGWLKSKGREEQPPELLVEDPEVRAEIQRSIDEANKTVSAAEAIKRFVVLPIDLTEESGHLTPKLSVTMGTRRCQFL